MRLVQPEQPLALLPTCNLHPHRAVHSLRLMLTSLYIAATIIGGGLVVIGLFHGHDSDGGFDGGHDAHIDLSHDAAVDHHGPVDNLWLPILSLRFWTYFLITFGLVGLIAGNFTTVQPAVVALAAAGAGLFTGLAVAYTIRHLADEIGSVTGVQDMLGMEGEVLVAVRPDSPGRIRCNIKGDSIDLLALSEGDYILQPGERAVVVAVDGDRARVVPRVEVFG
jgi:membrane protein implicated in regulation of membrane protease activity